MRALLALTVILGGGACATSTGEVDMTTVGGDQAVHPADLTGVDATGLDLVQPGNDLATASDLATALDQASTTDQASAADQAVANDQAMPDQATGDLVPPADMLKIDSFMVCTEAPGAFRLLAPLSTARVTSEKPQVEWLPSTQAYTYTVDFCDDPACTSIKESVSTAQTLAAPTNKLSQGARFWRVKAVSDCGQTPSSSGIWELRVGWRTATVNTWHAGFGFLDANLDGLIDLATSAASGDGAFYLNGKSGLDIADATYFNSGARPVVSVGDFNGDGYGDVLADTKIRPGTGTGLGTALAGTYEATFASTTSKLGAGIGDFDHDGYSDFAIFRGSNGESGSPDATIFFGNSTDTLVTAGGYLVGAGDVNGDGISDIAVAHAAFGNAGIISIYHGGHGRTLGTAATTITGFGATNNPFDFNIAGACDTNGDGYSDVLAIDANRTTAYVFYGSSTGIKTTGYTVLTVGATGGGAGLARGIACAGDVNGDGYDDVVAGSPYDGLQSTLSSGAVYVYHGGPSGPSGTASTVVDGNTNKDFTQLRYGASVAGVGDLDGDGYDDIATGAIQCNGKLLVSAGSESGVVVDKSLYTIAGDGSLCWGLEIAAAAAPQMCGG